VWSNKLNDTGLRAVTGSADFSARVWDALTGLELHQFPHKHIVRTVDFAHRSNRIVTGGEHACCAAPLPFAPFAHLQTTFCPLAACICRHMAHAGFLKQCFIRRQPRVQEPQEIAEPVRTSVCLTYMFAQNCDCSGAATQGTR